MGEHERNCWPPSALLEPRLPLSAKSLSAKSASTRPKVKAPRSYSHIPRPHPLPLMPFTQRGTGEANTSRERGPERGGGKREPSAQLQPIELPQFRHL